MGPVITVMVGRVDDALSCGALAYSFGPFSPKNQLDARTIPTDKNEESTSTANSKKDYDISVHSEYWCPLAQISWLFAFDFQCCLAK